MKTTATLAALLLAAAASAQLPPSDGTDGTYVCSDGTLGQLDFDSAAGLVKATRQGEDFTLFRQVGHTPARYVMGSDTIVVEPDHITLKRGQAERLRCDRRPDQPATGFVWGTLAKLDRMALPAGTRATVLLVDVSRMDAAAVEIAGTRLVTSGNQVPLNWLIAYDPARAGTGPSRAVQARIVAADGTLLYISDTHTPVLATETPQPPVDMMLVKVGAGR